MKNLETTTRLLNVEKELSRFVNLNLDWMTLWLPTSWYLTVISFLHQVRLGRVYMTQGKYQLAKKTFKRALKISEEKVGKEHPSTGDVIYELGCFYLMKPENIGAASSKKGNPLVKLSTLEWSSDKAQEWFFRALELKEKALGKDHPDVSRILNRIGGLYVEKVEYDKAEKYYTRVRTLH